MRPRRLGGAWERTRAFDTDNDTGNCSELGSKATLSSTAATRCVQETAEVCPVILTDLTSVTYGNLAYVNISFQALALLLSLPPSCNIDT